MSDIAIRVEHLGKKYEIGGQQARFATFRESLTNAASVPLRWLKGELRKEKDTFWALDDVSFEIKRGEAVGIIGRNGAGKSTLLKILSHITSPTTGRVDLYGRVGSLLEVGTGFHPELTGRENIYLNGAILGMSRVEIARKFDEIVDFSGVEKFLDTPVKHYSSGMYVRLAFAVAAHLEPEILLVDEVLAVGDAEFQKKCLGKMGDVANEGRTVLFVSHNMAAIEMLCRTCLLISQGNLIENDATKSVIGLYLNERKELASNSDLSNRADRSGQGDYRIIRIEILNEENKETDILYSGKPAKIVLTLNKQPQKPIVAFGIYDQFGSHIAGFTSNEKGDSDKVSIKLTNKYICRIPELLLPPGLYFINIDLVGNGKREDHIDGAIKFQVVEGYIRGRKVMSVGYTRIIIPHQWEIPPNHFDE